MSRKLVEQRLIEVSSRMKRLQEDLLVAEEQLDHFTHEAEDARIRSLVSETPVAEREHREANKHAVAMRRHRDEVVAELARLETSQNELLDRLMVES
jgi:hypothetical protein